MLGSLRAIEDVESSGRPYKAYVIELKVTLTRSVGGLICQAGRGIKV